MNIKSIVTTLSVLSATSTAALADASFSVHAQGSVVIGTDNNDGPVVRDHRYQQPAPAPVVVVKPARPHIRNDQDRIWVNGDAGIGFRKPYPRPVPQPELQIIMPRIDTRPNTNVSYYEGSYFQTAQRPGWVALTQATRIETIRENFNLANSGLIDQLRLDSVRGSTSISMLRIVFADGTSQEITVNKTIDASTPSITMDLKGRARQVSYINVYGKSSSGAAFVMLGSS